MLNMQARIEGRLQVFFYDTEAGMTEVNAKYARPRTVGNDPYILEVQYQAYTHGRFVPLNSHCNACVACRSYMSTADACVHACTTHLIVCM